MGWLARRRADKAEIARLAQEAEALAEIEYERMQRELDEYLSAKHKMQHQRRYIEDAIVARQMQKTAGPLETPDELIDMAVAEREWREEAERG